MTSENLVKETAKAIAAIYGEPSRWANYQIDARAAIRVIAPAVLEEAAIMMTPTNPKSDWTDYARNKARWADDIRALKTRYEP